jgi:hypothetical protein
MHRAFRLALAAAAAAVGGAAFAQVQVRPLPAPIPPPGGGIGAPARPVVYTGPTAFQKTVNAQLVVAGTVSVAKDTVQVPAYQGSPTKVTVRAATIKVTDTLLGEKAAAVKVLIPPADPTYINDPFPGQPPQPYYPQVPNNVQLIDGQEGVFFLTRHPTEADAFTHAGGSPPLNPLDTKYKEELAEVKAVGAVHADPVKALKAEKADDRMRAAFVLVTKYRRPPAYDGKVYEQKAIPAEEAKLIFKALQDADWELWDKPQQPGEVRDYTLNPTNLLGQLQVYPGAPGKGNFPQVRPQPGQGYHTAYKAAFTTWMEGDGKEFEIKRYLAPGEKKDEPKK